MVPRSLESAAYAIVATQDRSFRRLWLTEQVVYQHWWLAPWMIKKMRSFALNRQLGGQTWAGPRFQAAVVSANHAAEASAKTAQQRVKAHFKRRAEAFAIRQMENLRERAEAQAAGLPLPLLLLSKKTKLSDAERASKSAYRPLLPPPPPISEPVLVVAVGDYPVDTLASVENMHQQILWDVLQEHCAD